MSVPPSFRPRIITRNPVNICTLYSSARADPFPAAEHSSANSYANSEVQRRQSGSSLSGQTRSPPSEPQLRRRLAGVEAEIRRLSCAQKHLAWALQVLQDASSHKPKAKDSVS